jgi:hypothetical protein
LVFPKGWRTAYTATVSPRCGKTRESWHANAQLQRRCFAHLHAVGARLADRDGSIGIDAML